jgi:hypothetical protein
MSLLSPFPCHARAHSDPKKARSIAAAKSKMLRARAEEARNLAKALEEIADSGDTDANMTEAANIILSISGINVWPKEPPPRAATRAACPKPSIAARRLARPRSRAHTAGAGGLTRIAWSAGSASLGFSSCCGRDGESPHAPLGHVTFRPHSRSPSVPPVPSKRALSG